MKQKIIVLAVLMFVQTVMVTLSAQGYMSFDMLTSSCLGDELGGRFGSGSMKRVEAGYNIPVSMRRNEREQTEAWMVSVYGHYTELDNRGEADAMSPDDILNCGLNLTHIRPISRRWSVIATVGGGIYAQSDEMSLKRMLVNGGVVFVRKMNRNLDLGVGGGVTNSYGIPMAMPMIYLSWHKPGRYEFKIDMMSGMKVSAATWIGRHVNIEQA